MVAILFLFSRNRVFKAYNYIHLNFNACYMTYQMIWRTVCRGFYSYNAMFIAFRCILRQAQSHTQGTSVVY